MFLTFSVLGLVDEGRVSLRAVLQESSMGKVLLEHALSHTSGHLKLAPGSSDLSFREFCDSEVLAEKMLAEEPLLGPGLRQQYEHTSFGLLVHEACKLAGTSLETAWQRFADEANARLLLDSPPSGAQPVSQMRSPSLEDLGKRMEEFEHFVDATNRGRSKNATKGQKAEHGMWMSFFGREHWFNPAALNRDLPRTSVLPGRQGFATAKDTAKALRAAAAGQALSQRMWREASRSRKPEKGPDSEPCRLPHHLERFQDAEWGLGLQMLRLPNGHQALGHSACNGSFAVLLQRRSRPVVVAFLVNRSDGAVAAEKVLSALVED